MSSFFTKLCKATLLLLLFFPWTADAQLNVNFTVNTTADKKVISPYVYGINATNTPASYQSITTAIRLGGNRMTGYNWENNASHAGHDWNHQNDNYLPWYYNVPSADYNTPGSLLTYLHDLNVANNAYSLITLPMAGYVARDKNGTAVSTGEVAPSARWLKVVNNKGSAFSLAPNTSDGFIYVDEEMNFLINRYGKANTPTGIRGYSLDNEPCLWSSSHPRIHSSKVTVKELLDNSVALSKTIKGMDEYAEVFGPALYGFNAYTTLQQAPDWSVTYNRSNRYTRFVDFYLDSMRIASNASGKRLLDVLDVHWYSDVSGMSGDNTSLTVPKHIERMQITRSLWDSSYVENSWIGTWYSPVAIIPYLNKSIARYYPDTKLAITEYDFGAADYFSGGIAQADALGLFGKYGLYYTNNTTTLFVSCLQLH